MKVVELKKKIGLKVKVVYRLELQNNITLLNNLSEKDTVAFIQVATANKLDVFDSNGTPTEIDLQSLTDKVVVIANTDCNCRKSITDYITQDKNNYYILIDCYRGMGRKARFEEINDTLTLKYE